MEQRELAKTFDADVPPSAQLELCGLVSAAHESSWQEANETCEPEFRKAIAGHLRWVRIEQALIAFARRHSGMRARPLPNSNASSSHVEIVTKRFIITACSVDSPWAMVPHARFRETLASSPQTTIPLPEFDVGTPSGTHTYAVILHARAERAPGQVSSIGVAFPNSQLTGYLGRIDLLARFRSQLTVSAPRTEAVSVPEPRVALKTEADVRS